MRMQISRDIMSANAFLHTETFAGKVSHIIHDLSHAN